MRSINWTDHKKHRRQVIKDTGEVLFLMDEDWVPFLRLPPVVSADWPETRGIIDSVKLTVHVRTPSGRVHAVVDELVAENLGRVDQVGKLIPVTGPARSIRMEREGQSMTMLITHVVAEGDAWAPHTLTIHGVRMLAYLDLLPCPSNPLSWKGTFTRFERDWVGPEDMTETFEKPRDLAPMTMIAVADGASVDGMSDQVIYRLIDESLDAVHRVAGIENNPPYRAILETPTGTPVRLIHRPTDQTIWQEIGERALSAGVSIRAQLWWPGDTPVDGVSVPTLIFRVRQEA